MLLCRHFAYHRPGRQEYLPPQHLYIISFAALERNSSGKNQEGAKDRFISIFAQLGVGAKCDVLGTSTSKRRVCTISRTDRDATFAVIPNMEKTSEGLRSELRLRDSQQIAAYGG